VIRVVASLSALFIGMLPLAAQSLSGCRSLERRGRHAESGVCYQRLASSSDPYLRAEAFWALGRYQEANDEFRNAVARDPKNPDYRVRWGRLYLDRMQPGDAITLFREALEINDDHAGAILGMALVAAEGFESQAAALAGRALAANPKLAEARVLLARLALEDGNLRKAEAEAARALSLEPDNLEALALGAVIEWLEDKPEPANLDRIFRINPVYGEVYAAAGRFFVLNRRYEEGIRFYRKAIGLNPRLLKARAELGLNLMRLGYDAEAREQLEYCYNAGERYAAVNNPLRLLESYKNFRYIKAPGFILKLHEREADLLQPYFEAEVKRAVAAYEKKYGFRLERPVQVEVYPDHEDFAVRTLGMPGLGALGVTFGYVVAMDSPSGRKPGELHWASTLWHELSHVFTLNATSHRVPRWFSEGMAVYEETAVSPEWGDRTSPAVINAVRDKKLLPVDQLDRGFMHPDSAGQVVVSYFQAGRICNFVDQEWGFPKLIEMLKAFGARKTTPAAIEDVLGLSSKEFDARFQAWLEQEMHTVVEGFERWKKGLARVLDLVKSGDNGGVIREATAIRDLYPDFVEDGNVYEALADAYLANGDRAAARAELDRYVRAGGRKPSRLKQLASMLEDEARPAGAIAVLERLNYLYPRDEELHRKLGDLLMAEGRAQEAIREYRAVIALKPLDKAASHYNLARAYRAANRLEEARSQVLLSLEAAPGYRPAQKLLLELNP